MAQMASAKTDLDDTEIHSPSDGVIITRTEEPGAIVQMGLAVALACRIDQRQIARMAGRRGFGVARGNESLLDG